MKSHSKLFKAAVAGLFIFTAACGERAPAATPQAESDKPDGILQNGVRVIPLSPSNPPATLYVYRGEEVRLVIAGSDAPYSVHIPAYKISRKNEIGKELHIEFKAADAGVFPMFCNGKCATGDGQSQARIVVMEYRADDKAGVFKNIGYKEAVEYIAREKPLILDVRTPNEFHEGYIKDAVLIPVQQLELRVDEIAAYKDKPVLVYCRSGNRSIPAAQILIEKGFKEVYNLTGGIREWMREGGTLEK